MTREEDSRMALAAVFELGAVVALAACAFLWWQIPVREKMMVPAIAVLAGVAWFIRVDRRRTNRAGIGPVVAAAVLPILLTVAALYLEGTRETALAALFAVGFAGIALRLRSLAVDDESRTLKSLLERQCVVDDDALNALAAADVRLEIRRAAQQVGRGFERPVRARELRDAMNEYLGYPVPEQELERVIRYSLR